MNHATWCMGIWWVARAVGLSYETLGFHQAKNWGCKATTRLGITQNEECEVMILGQISINLAEHHEKRGSGDIHICTTTYHPRGYAITITALLECFRCFCFFLPIECAWDDGTLWFLYFIAKLQLNNTPQKGRMLQTSWNMTLFPWPFFWAPYLLRVASAVGTTLVGTPCEFHPNREPWTSRFWDQNLPASSNHVYTRWYDVGQTRETPIDFSPTFVDRRSRWYSHFVTCEWLERFLAFALHLDSCKPTEL